MNAQPVESDVPSPSLKSQRRPRSRHEIVTMYAQKPLPLVPAKSRLRHNGPQGKSCSDSAISKRSTPTSPKPEPARWSLYPRQTSCSQTLKSSPSTTPKQLPKSSSLSSLPQASQRTSSQKVHQLVGHDLFVMGQAKAGQPQQPVRQSTDYSFLDEYYATCSTGSDSEAAHLHSEDGLLPLIEEDDETASSRESSWVPRTPVAVPEPLNIWRKVSSESGDSVRSDISSNRSSVRNFSLHSTSPKRWDPAYGRFTDRKAAGAYHQIASELARSLPQQKSQQLQMFMDKGGFGPEVVTADAPPTGQKNHGKKSWTPGRLRLSGTAALARLWDTSPPPEAKTRPAAPVRRNTLKKPVRMPAKATTKSATGTTAAAPATVRVIPSSDARDWPMVEQLAIRESPSKKTLQESPMKRMAERDPLLQEPRSNTNTLMESPMKRMPARIFSVPESCMAHTAEERPSTGSSERRTLGGRGVPLTIDTEAATAAPLPKKSPVLKKPAAQQHSRSQSMPTITQPQPKQQSPAKEESKAQAQGVPCSAFDSDTEDEDGDRGGIRWFSRRAQEDEPEWPRVQWTRQVEATEKEPTLFAKTGGQMKGLITNARERALMSPAERRRSELRRSIKVLLSP